MTNKKPNTFSYKNKKYTVIKPNNKIRRESDAVYAKAYRQAIKDGYFLEAEVQSILSDRGYNEKESNKSKNLLLQESRKLESKLAKGEISSEEEGRKIAFRVRDLREEYNKIDEAKNELTSQCANTIAENKRFSYFAYACVLDSEGKRVWDSFDEFESDESEFAYTAASEVLSIIYDDNRVIVKNMEMQKYENKWLIDHGFMDDDFYFLNKEGSRVDTDGRLIDEDFNYINTDGQRVDMLGNLIDEAGQIVTETKKATSTKKKTTRKKSSTKNTTNTPD
jgi:hypothetical protein